MPSRSGAHAALRIVLLVALSLAAGQPAELKNETVSAWDSYMVQQNLDVKQRATKEEGFFWTDAVPDRFEKLRSGKVLAEPVGGQNPIRVPGGLIHHWISAVFIPNATIDDVLVITRDYGHYKEYFKPGVADASASMKSESRDEFTIRFVNPSALSKSSLEGNYVSEFVHISADRFYSTSVTTTMCEIKNFGCPTEKQFPSDQGSGYIWRLYSTARMENRDGGVLLEMEAIALSREIPGALRWVVDPIVRRVSRESIEKSLAETDTAVRERVTACAVQNSHLPAATNQIIESGTCLAHASNTNLRAQRLSGHTGR